MLVRGVYVRKGELFRRETIQKLGLLRFRKLRFSLRPKISKSNGEASPLTNTCLLQTYQDLLAFIWPKETNRKVPKSHQHTIYIYMIYVYIYT